MPFIHDDFLLNGEEARKLFHQCAAPQPILDFHNHLSAADIATDRQYENLHDIWLAGDHYKWRAMRAAGVDENLITGDADPLKKFLAWAETTPQALRNPLYHWTHLELLRYFGIDQLLCKETAEAIWHQTAEMLQSPEMSARSILSRFQVRALCTTDDPADDLCHHRKIADSGFHTKVFPTFRPDEGLRAEDPQLFNEWVDRVAAVSDRSIISFDDFLGAIRARHDAFHALGCRLSDHGLPHCYDNFCHEGLAAGIFDKVRGGRLITEEELSQYRSFMMLFFAHLDAEKGWTKQLHLGAIRNNSSRLRSALGADAGGDSIGDWPQVESLARYLDHLDREGRLPKMIVYNVNPRDNYSIATMLGNFQDGTRPGKLQWGAAWWYLDQKQGMQQQLDVLSNIGLLAEFVGMVTDSRSMMSLPRHEYFRRVLCDLIGQDMQRGELPDDLEFIGGVVSRICYDNAAEFLELELP